MSCWCFPWKVSNADLVFGNWPVMPASINRCRCQLEYRYNTLCPKWSRCSLFNSRRSHHANPCGRNIGFVLLWKPSNSNSSCSEVQFLWDNFRRSLGWWTAKRGLCTLFVCERAEFETRNVQLHKCYSVPTIGQVSFGVCCKWSIPSTT